MGEVQDGSSRAFWRPDLALADGVRMPLLGFGTWELSGSQAQRAAEWALATGYRHIDTATGYGNEALVGEALRSSGVGRDEVFVTTKMPPDHVGRERRTLEESLHGLGVDNVDLWLIHWPPRGGPGLESWQEFIRAREEGLATLIGVSNYAFDQIDVLTHATGVAPAVNQIEWSPFRYDPKVVSGHQERGIAIEGYSPFNASRLDDPALTAIAKRHHKTPAQVIVRWHLQHGVVVLPRSSRRERIESNADVFDFELDESDVTTLDGLGRPSTPVPS